MWWREVMMMKVMMGRREGDDRCGGEKMMIDGAERR